MTWKQLLRRRLEGTGTALLAGAMFFVVVGRLEPNTHVPGLALFGGVYGLTVLGLLRLFGARRWACLFAGLLCGPVPLAVLSKPSVEPAEYGGMLVATAALGALVGLFEWSRQSRSSRDDATGT